MDAAEERFLNDLGEKVSNDEEAHELYHNILNLLNEAIVDDKHEMRCVLYLVWRGLDNFFDELVEEEDEIVETNISN